MPWNPQHEYANGLRGTYADAAADPAEAQASLNGLAAWLDVWEVDPEARTLVALVSPDEYAVLVAAGYALEVDRELSAQLLVPPGYPCYRTVEQLYATLAETVTLNFDHEIGQYIAFGGRWPNRLECGKDASFDLTILYSLTANEGADIIIDWFFASPPGDRTLAIYLPDKNVGSDYYSAEVKIEQVGGGVEDAQGTVDAERRGRRAPLQALG